MKTWKPLPRAEVLAKFDAVWLQENNDLLYQLGSTRPEPMALLPNARLF